MEDIRIISPGLLTTVQDLGREGYREFGVPTSGAVDKLSMQLANLLVGNERGEAVLEMTVAGPAVLLQSNCAFAITGADLSPRINGRPVELHKTIYAAKGDVLEFASSVRGARSYIAFSGGLQIKEVMGSKSTYLRGGFGGLQGRKLKAGDVLNLKASNSLVFFGIRKTPEGLIPQYSSEAVVRVILGPDKDDFTDEGLYALLNSEFTLTNQWDRMGCRLEGPKITHRNGADIISSGLIPGTIQVPGHGSPIIMLADAQTTGGYTRAANVASVDMPYLAQLKPGDRLQFEEIELKQAHKLVKEQEEKLLELAEEYNKSSVATIGSLKSFSVAIDNSRYNVMVQELEQRDDKSKL